MDQQSATITATTHSRFHKQIFQIKPRSAEPGGEVKEINREPNGFGIFKCNHHLRRRLRAKKHFMQTFLRGDNVIGRALVGRQITYQLYNDWDVSDGGIANFKISFVHFFKSERERPSARTAEDVQPFKIADVAAAVTGGSFRVAVPNAFGAATTLLVLLRIIASSRQKIVGRFREAPKHSGAT